MARFYPLIVSRWLILEFMGQYITQVMKKFQRNEQLILGMTMVLKYQGQDDYFSQQSILLTITSLPKSSNNQ